MVGVTILERPAQRLRVVELSNQDYSRPAGGGVMASTSDVDREVLVQLQAPVPIWKYRKLRYGVAAQILVRSARIVQGSMCSTIPTALGPIPSTLSPRRVCPCDVVKE